MNTEQAIEFFGRLWPIEPPEEIKLAIAALRAMRERETPKPLSWEQLKGMVGEAVYRVVKSDWQTGKYPIDEWVIIQSVRGRCIYTSGGATDFEYADFYAHRPKEVSK